MSMKETMWRVPALLLLAAMVVLTANSVARAWMGPPAKVGVFEPVKRPIQPGPVDVLLRFAPPEGYEGDSIFHVTATAREAGVYTGRKKWTITASPDQPGAPPLAVGGVLSVMHDPRVGWPTLWVGFVRMIELPEVLAVCAERCVFDTQPSAQMVRVRQESPPTQGVGAPRFCCPGCVWFRYGVLRLLRNCPPQADGGPRNDLMQGVVRIHVFGGAYLVSAVQISKVPGN